MNKPVRDFVFIDESGDPGRLGLEGSSSFYLIVALHVTNLSLRELVEHFSRLRYFHGFTKELKNVYKNPVLLRFLLDIYNWITQKGDVSCTAGYLLKSRYMGPYLSERRYGGYNPNLFRNYILRRVLERHFLKNRVRSSELEIVIDRFYSKESEEENLFNYLRGNFRLPKILHLVQVDSRYTEGVQLTDLIGRVIKAKHIDKWDRIDEDELRFAEIVCLNEIPKRYPNVLGKQK